MKKIIAIGLILGLTIGCKGIPGLDIDLGGKSNQTVNQTTNVTIGQPTPNTQIANPASEYCIKNGGKVETRKDDKGNEYGVCKFPNGKECEEWAFYKGECKP